MEFNLKVVPELARRDFAQFEKVLQLFFTRPDKKLYPLYMQRNYDAYENYVIADILSKSFESDSNGISKKDMARLIKFNGPLVLEYVLAYRVGKAEYNERDVAHLVSVLISDSDREFARRARETYLKVSKKVTKRTTKKKATTTAIRAVTKTITTAATKTTENNSSSNKSSSYQKSHISSNNSS